MRYIQKMLLQLTILLGMSSLAKVAAQPVTDAFYCSRELTQLKRVFLDTPHISFQAQHIITYTDGTRDTVCYQFKVSANKMYLECSDSTSIIQNEHCNLMVNRTQHNMSIGLPADVFQYVSWVRVSEPAFYTTFVKGRAYSDSGSYRKLSYEFKAASPYRTYDVIYERATHRIHSIQYSFNNEGAMPGNKMRSSVTISFSNYQTGVFTDSEFSTDAYFIRKQGIYNMAAPYSSYKFTNLQNQ